MYQENKSFTLKTYTSGCYKWIGWEPKQVETGHQMTPAKGIGKYCCDTWVIPEIPLNIMYDSKSIIQIMF